MKDLPKITIGIPTWNRSAYLCDALHSVLAQTYKNLEIVVSDNASTDDTIELLKGFTDSRIALIRQTSNIGGIANLNVCLRNATGELFLLLSDDDILDPMAIEKLGGPFREGAGGIQPEAIGLTWCPCKTIDAHGAGLWTTAKGPETETSVSMFSALFRGDRGPRLASVMVRTRDAQRVGGYDYERHRAICDTGNLGKVALLYDYVVCIQEPLVKYRMHESSHTSQSVCSDWQKWGSTVHEDLLDVLRSRNDVGGQRLLAKTRDNMLANLTIDVLLRSKGKPGWIWSAMREFWRSRSFMISPYVGKRLLRDGWKLLR